MPKQSKARRAQRIRFVAEMTLDGATTATIRIALAQRGYHVSAATIDRDRREAIARFAAENVEAMNELRAITNARCERLIATHWLNALSGDLAATDQIMKIMELEWQINGMDPPIKRGRRK